MKSNELKEYTVKKGTEIKLHGIPVQLKEDTKVLCGTSLEKINETRKDIYPRNKSK